MAQVIEIPIRRAENNQPWGFRLKGGVDQGIPLHVEQVNPNGRAGHAGVLTGDYILAICRTDVTSMTHQQVKGEMLRAGNELDVIVQRGEGQGGAQFIPAAAPASAPAAEPRSQVCEESIPTLGGARYKDHQTKTFQVLEDELPASEAGMGDRPQSIFNRNKQERSGYLHAKGPTIQKAYGQS